MTLTDEQQKIIDACLDPKITLLLVEAVSGAGKTATLIEIALATKPKRGRYLAYNKAIATEATEKFAGTNIECSTIHSLAYQAVVRPYGLKVGFFKARDVDKTYPYQARLEIAGIIEDFCLSASTDVNEYLANATIVYENPNLVKEGIQVHLDKMARGDIACNHSFYLKFYHLMLATGEIVPPEMDILMLDEFGDITGLTLEIFKLMNAKMKIAVGDSMQTIYRFNKTINGFKALEGQGTLLKLSQSFRVSTQIAQRIELFCNEYMKRDNIEFKGMDYPSIPPIASHAYIARTNSSLIAEMIRLDNMNIPYSLTRSVKAMFSLLLTLMNLKEGMTVHDAQYKFIERDIKKYYDSKDLKQRYATPAKYVMYKHEDDITIMGAFRLLQKHSYTTIYSVYGNAKDHEATKRKQLVTLTTAHSSKGLEYDKVTLLPDMNEAFSFAYTEYLSIQRDPEATDADEFEALNNFEDETKLYYVATSRARYIIENAGYLPNA